MCYVQLEFQVSDTQYGESLQVLHVRRFTSSPKGFLPAQAKTFITENSKTQGKILKKKKKRNEYFVQITKTLSAL